MRTICFNSRTTSSSSVSGIGQTAPARTVSGMAMDRTLEIAELIITKWDQDTSSFAKVTSLFHENRAEAKEFIRCMNELQKAMHSVVSENSNSEKLIRAQCLMEIGMKRLQKEFYQILSMNRAHLDPESVSTRSSLSTRSSISDYEDNEDDKIRLAGESITEVEDVSTVAMTDLRLIAECMISSGYGKECVKIYKIIRKSIVDEGIYRLGVEKVTSSHIHKMDWEVLEIRIKSWLNAVNVAMKTLFNGERILCDHVFASSDSIRESCFTEITREGASILFGFTEIFAKSSKKSPVKVFRSLDMYTAIASHWQEIDSIFSFDSTSAVRSQALTSLIKLGELVKTALIEFESEIQKDKSKTSVPGAGIHHLTVDVMNYLSLLADYSNVLGDILADMPAPSISSLPASIFDGSDSDDSQSPARSTWFAWLILILLCKLDGMAKQYSGNGNVSFSYLFLATNLQHVISKVRTSNLKYLLGDDWVTKQEVKVKQFATSYERLAWDHVVKSLPLDPSAPISTDQAKEWFRRFNNAFEQAYYKQSACIVSDGKLRDEIKLSIAKKIIPTYRKFYDTHRRVTIGREKNLYVVRFAPEDVGNKLSDLFFEGAGSSGSSSSMSSSSLYTRTSRSH
ncbi:hypothetical protein RJ640_024202 [Escallonia rubra]|uniref:Exocyst subunit Exo70 family protein n=1 Tax=Escallonia rubra TaxID=112253 RepID=A0AA88R7G9_9ASTE|nr:hypothetical protein RJ640_024202 [Escallonia rubra]